MLKKSLEDVINNIDVHQLIEALGEVNKNKKETTEKLVNLILKKLGFWSDICVHPLVRKANDWGGIARICKKKDTYKELIKKVKELRDRNIILPADVDEIKKILSKVRDEVIAYIIERVHDTRQGLRHLHSPGSVANTEGSNLHFGEHYTEEILSKMALRLCNSISIGNNIGLYCENEGLMHSLKQLCMPKFMLDLNEIGISKYESRYPYIVFIKFLLWLKRKYNVEEDPRKKHLLSSILECLRSSPVSIFFMPGGDKTKWRTINMPRLDFFIKNWLESEETTRNFEMMITTINDFLNLALREARTENELEKARNIVDLIMQNYEMLFQRLLEYGVPDYYSLKNMIDLMVELGIRYDIQKRLYSLRILT